MSDIFPPIPPPPGVPPPPAPRRSWFRRHKVLTVLGVVVLVVIVAAVAGGGSETDPPAETDTEGPATQSGNTDNPPTADVSLDVCGVGAADFIEASGLITNHSSKASTYFIEVEFVAGGVRYGEGIASSSTVAPDQKVEWSASGVVEARPETTCRITSVERFAA